jgi:hypothetical protein
MTGSFLRSAVRGLALGLARALVAIDRHRKMKASHVTHQDQALAASGDNSGGNICGLVRSWRPDLQ